MSDLRPGSPVAAAGAHSQPPQPRLESGATAADIETAAEGSSDEDQVLVAWQAHNRKLEGLLLSEDVSEASTEESERIAARRAAGEAQPGEVQVPPPGDGGMKPALPAQGGIATTPQTSTPTPKTLAHPADSYQSIEKGAGPANLAPGRPELMADARQAHAQSVLLMGADPAASESPVSPQPERPQMGGNPNLAQVELMMDSDAPPPQTSGGDSPLRPHRPQMDDSAVRAQDNVM